MVRLFGNKNPRIYRKKCGIVGFPSSGKSHLVKSFVSPVTTSNDPFGNQYQMTINANVSSRSIQIQNDQLVELFFIDTGGHEIFSEQCDKYVRDLDALVFVYDVTQKESYIQAQILLKKYRTLVGDAAYLIANKIDLTSGRIISSEMGQELAKQFGLAGYFECSAALKLNVEDTFQNIARDLVAGQANTA